MKENYLNELRLCARPRTSPVSSYGDEMPDSLGRFTKEDMTPTKRKAISNYMKHNWKNPIYRERQVQARIAKINPDEIMFLYSCGMSLDAVATTLNSTQKAVLNCLKRNNIKRRGKGRIDQRGDKNPSWKGNDAGYSRLHARVQNTLGNPKKCSVCGTTDPTKKYDWANKTGKYYDVNDYIRACRSCHCIMDIKKRKENACTTM